MKRKATSAKKKISPSARPKKAPANLDAAAANNSRELLMVAARDLFSENGYEGTSTRDIAKRAGVNISLISYHFQGKEGLYRACLEVLSKAGLETVERVLKKPTSVEDFKTRLQIFMEDFIQLHLTNPATSCIMMKEVFNGTTNPIILELFRTKFVVIFGSLIEFLTYAQKQKYINSSADVEIVGMMIMGCISHVMRTEEMRKNILGVPGLLEPNTIDKTITQLANNLLNGILPR